ncbi:MAG: hypothetical protein PVF43_05165 [Candidatus Eiseniibacteriota bacterium]|jgi:hypothetical protein
MTAQRRSARRSARSTASQRSDGTGLLGLLEGLSDRGWAIALAGLASAHRLFFLFSNDDRVWPLSLFYEGDAATFYQFARAILNGRLYDSGVPFHPPGFAYFLAGLHWLLGAPAGAPEVPFLAIKSVLAILSGGSVGLIFLLVRPYLGRLVALLTAVLCLYHFGLYVIAVSPVSEGTYLLLLLLALLVWSRGLDHPLAAPGRWRWRLAAAHPTWTGLGLGLLLGLLALTRAESVLIAGLLGIVGLLGWWRARSRPPAPGRALIPWLLVAGGWMIAVTPWTIRNAIQLRAATERLELAEPLPTFVPLTLYGPLNLALANHAHADGAFSPVLLNELGRSGRLQLQDPQHLRLILHGHRVAWEWVSTHPADFGRLVLRKWSIFFAALKLGWTQWDLPGGLHGLRRAVDLFAPQAWTAAWIQVPLILLGLLLCLQAGGAARRWGFLVLLLTLAGLITTTLFYGYVRQGMLLVPFWLSTVAVAIQRLVAARPRDHLPRAADALPRRWLQGLLVVAVVLFLVEGWAATRTRSFTARGRQLPDGGGLNPDMPVEIRPSAGP